MNLDENFYYPAIEELTDLVKENGMFLSIKINGHLCYNLKIKDYLDIITWPHEFVGIDEETFGLDDSDKTIIEIMIVKDDKEITFIGKNIETVADHIVGIIERSFVNEKFCYDSRA